VTIGPQEPVLVLASGSPRRAELLREAGIPFLADPAHVDEATRAGEAPEAYVQRLAVDKARAVARRHPERVVLAADTTVVVDGTVLGKPADREDAARMLRLLSGRDHLVLTGVCLVVPPDGAVHTDIAATTVAFKPLDAAEIAAYVDSGEPMDKAGAYAIQGGAAPFVRHLDGSYSNVVGLPVSLVRGMCRALGIQVS
jgi:septum formation protein